MKELKGEVVAKLKQYVESLRKGSLNERLNTFFHFFSDFTEGLLLPTAPSQTVTKKPAVVAKKVQQSDSSSTSGKPGTLL